jgi:hypothetical protein
MTGQAGTTILMIGVTTRGLNLLDNRGKNISNNVCLLYYDRASGRNYHDGRQFKIAGMDFSDNDASDDGSVAGLVMSAYSLMVTDCLFETNSAKFMVFVYNDDVLVDNTVFAENMAEVSEVVGFGQRDYHVAGTVFIWASTCKGAAAEETGDDCLETGDCVGMCIEFMSGECLASWVDSGGYEQYSNAAGGRNGGKYVRGGWGALLGAVLLVMLII